MQASYDFSLYTTLSWSSIDGDHVPQSAEGRISIQQKVSDDTREHEC